MSRRFQRAAAKAVLQTLTPAQTQEQYTSNYCAVAAAVFLLYDYVVTIGQESRYIWTDVHAGYAAIFLINRLNMLGMAISLIMNLCSFHTLTSCKQINIFWDMVTISTALIWACISTLRVYVISNRSILLAVITAAFAAVPIVVNIFSYTKTIFFLESIGASTTCAWYYTFSTQTTNEIVILSRASTTASDLMVLIVTWWQLYGTLRSSTQKRNRSALVVLLLRDSTSYFVLLLLMNIAQIIAAVMLTQNFNPIPNFMLPITCIVISRLILNLRQLSFAMRSPMHAQSDTTSPPRSTVPSSFHPSLLSTIMFGPNSQGSQGRQMPPVPPESPSHSPESALESGLIDVRDHVMDDIVEDDEDEKEDADAE